MYSRITALMLIAGSTVAAAGCTPKHDAPHETDASANATTPVPANVLAITATDFAFDAPDSVPAGYTTIRVTTKGRELHHASLVRLEQGKTAEDFIAALKAGGPPPAWMVDAGGPNPPVPNGGVSEVTEMLEPGNYVIVCFVPSPDGTPHVMKGMLRPLTVTGPVTAAAAPVPDATITLADYSFTMSAPLTAGHHVIRVDNTGMQSHEIFVARLAPGKTAMDLVHWVESQKGPPPAEPLGGVAAIAVSDTTYLPLDLTPGHYALVCFLPDAKDGKPHAVHGMVKEITVM